MLHMLYTSGKPTLHLRHLHNVKTRFYCPQAVLGLDCHWMFLRKKWMFWDWNDLYTHSVLYNVYVAYIHQQASCLHDMLGIAF